MHPLSGPQKIDGRREIAPESGDVLAREAVRKTASPYIVHDNHRSATHDLTADTQLGCEAVVGEELVLRLAVGAIHELDEDFSWRSAEVDQDALVEATGGFLGRADFLSEDEIE